MTVLSNAERCRQRYYADREHILAQRRSARDAARLATIEEAVRFGRPVGRSLPVCGTRAAQQRHAAKRQVCGDCLFLAAVEWLNRTYVSPTDRLARKRDWDRTSYERNRESRLAANRAWRDAHPEEMRGYQRRYAQTDEARAKRAAWRSANPDRMRELRRANYERVGRESWRARGAAWRAANPERARSITDAAKAARRSRIASLPREHIDRNLVWVRDAGICHICSLPADPRDWHLDHVLPIAAGGPHLYQNVRVSHPLCNRRKGAKTA